MVRVEQFSVKGKVKTCSVCIPGTSECFLFSVRPKLCVYHTTEYNDHYVYFNTHQETMPNGLVRTTCSVLGVCVWQTTCNEWLRLAYVWQSKRNIKNCTKCKKFGLSKAADLFLLPSMLDWSTNHSYHDKRHVFDAVLRNVQIYRYSRCKSASDSSDRVVTLLPERLLSLLLVVIGRVELFLCSCCQSVYGDKERIVHCRVWADNMSTSACGWAPSSAKGTAKRNQLAQPTRVHSCRARKSSTLTRSKSGVLAIKSERKKITKRCAMLCVFATLIVFTQLQY